MASWNGAGLITGIRLGGAPFRRTFSNGTAQGEAAGRALKIRSGADGGEKSFRPEILFFAESAAAFSGA